MNSTYKLCAMIDISIPKLLTNLIVMEATLYGFTAQDFMHHAGAACAIILAFLLRIAMEWGKDTLTAKSAVIQAVSTMALCFVSIYVWHDFLKYSKGFEIYVFFSSLFSVFIVAEIEAVFKIGFRKWLRTAMVKIMASDDKEETK